MFAIHLDETTDINIKLQLLAFLQICLPKRNGTVFTLLIILNNNKGLIYLRFDQLFISGSVEDILKK